ncbi:FMN-dependent NADH-azoreductase, partial [Stenotrophomonas muris]|uniref:FMN-dependent NADH-azoreductase n=1 Tax=Stenotrophomonas muris TaxID=2963283 RepID=UPI00383AE3A6
MKLLHLDASVLGDNSVSRQLSAAVVARLASQIDGLQVDYRDLDASPVPHLRSSSLAKTDAAEATDAEQVMQQFLEADIVVIGAPMYNFSIPSTLKAWIDRVAVAGRTFKYTENGPVGLAGGKRVIGNPKGESVEIDLLRAGEARKDVSLSIDRRIQYLAFKELRNALVANKAAGGSMVIMDVTTGEILAM